MWGASTPSHAGDETSAAEFPIEDRIRIAEAFRIADRLGDKVWSGWSEAPRAVLLVTPDWEYLVHHPYPTSDFTKAGYDSIVNSEVYTRPRVFNPHLLATFPAVAGVPTVVIGQPGNTDASHSTRWVTTLLHEHFHQWQLSQPDYYSAVNDLGLARGDTTGMWMLNYDFPYDSPPVRAAFSHLCKSAAVAVKKSGKGPVADYLQAKARLRSVLDTDDYAYFSFQLWQEGIARYTEVRLAEAAGLSYRPTPRFTALPDYRSFGTVADETRTHFLTELLSAELETSRRVTFYHIGAAEALLLDRMNPEWQREYFSHKFFTDKYFQESSH